MKYRYQSKAVDTDETIEIPDDAISISVSKLISRMGRVNHLNVSYLEPVDE